MGILTLEHYTRVYTLLLMEMFFLQQSWGKKQKQNKTNKNAENYSYREMNRLSFRQPSVNTTNIPMNYTFKMSSHYCWAHSFEQDQDFP